MSNTATEAQKGTITGGEQGLFDHARQHHEYEGEDDYGQVEKHFLKKGLCPKRIGECFVLKRW